MKENALITATRMLDRRQWVGTEYDDPQTLDWPRSGVTDPEGVAVDETVVPQFILDATCELALALMEDASVQTGEGSNIKSIETGSVGVEFFGASNASSTGFPTIIQEIIGYYLAGQASFSGPFVARHLFTRR